MGTKKAVQPVLHHAAAFITPRRSILLFAFFLLLSTVTYAGRGYNPEDEITVNIEVKDVGALEIPALYDGKDLYLSVTHVFDFLKVRNIPSPYFDSLTGFYINEGDQYVLDANENTITFKGKLTITGSGELVHSDNAMYMHIKYFKSIFGLNGDFNFRRLWVTFTTDAELPVVREMRLETMRKNANRLRGEQKADTTIRRKFQAFHLGAVDWGVLATQQSQGFDDTRINLGLGGVLLGGQTDVSLNYYSRQPFNELQQYYQWRYVNNDMRALRQVAAGKIFTQATSTLYAPVVGIQLSNSPTTHRQSYGTYLLSAKTEPNWLVELYVNEVLVDYKKADASGQFSFDVPLLYGYTTIKLRFYGPYGEERTNRVFVNIPYNFLPRGQFEYNVSAGIVEDGKNSIITRANLGYGVTPRLTIGGGVEYLSSVTSGPAMPFFNTAFRLSSRLLLSGEYTHGVRSRGMFTWRLPSSAQFDLEYTKYVKGQTAIYFNFLEERKGTLSIPVRAGGLTIFGRLVVDNIVIPNTQYTNTELAFTGSVRTVGVNLSTYASFVKTGNPYFFTLASVSLMLPLKINFTSQVQYDYKNSRLSYMKFMFEKYVFVRGYINGGYQEFFSGTNNDYFKTPGYRNFNIGLRYDFSFARVGLSALNGSNNTYNRVQTASGGFVFDRKTRYIDINNRTNVGKGGIVVKPFLDLNANGKRDKDEPNAPGLKIRVNGGRISYGRKDSAIRVSELEPFTNYYIELNHNSFDNIAWQMKLHTIKVTVEANQYTLVEVPVYVMGEISGTVSLKPKEGKRKKGQGQMIVNIYDKAGHFIARAITEGDGYFSYIGLAPGSYVARMDAEQLKKLRFTSSPEFPFVIHALPSNDGDVVNNAEFSLQTAD